MDDAEKIAILYVPCGTEEEAVGMARTLISEQLIACANIYTSRSLYQWDGGLADEPEYVIFAKTTFSLAKDAERRIGELHSYQVPCVITVQPASVNGEYAAWVAAQVAGEKRMAAAQTGEA